MDPIFLFLQILFTDSSEISTNLIILSFRLLFIVFAWLEFFRYCSNSFCGLIVGAHLILSIISWLQKSAPQIFLGKHISSHILQKYDTLRSILNIMHDPISVCVATVMFSGFVGCISINFATLKMYDVIPMPLYLTFPVLGVVIPTFIHIMMPMMIAVYEGAVVLQRKWGRALGLSKDVKYLKRKLRAEKAVRIYSGVFGYELYFVRNSTKSTYQYVIVGHTISALMSVSA